MVIEVAKQVKRTMYWTCRDGDAAAVRRLLEEYPAMAYPGDVQGPDAFAQANRVVTDRYEHSRVRFIATGKRHDMHVGDTFADMVEALREARSRRLFGDEVFLCVCSSDPSRRLSQLQEDSVQALKSPLMFEKWRRASAR